MRLHIDVAGDVQISRDLLRFGERAEDMSPAFSALADDFYAVEQAQFASEGAFASGGWAPLAPSTLLGKTGPGILRETDALYSSLTSPTARGAVRRITSDQFEIGTEVRSERGFPYPAAHQHGTSRMPRRRPIEFREVDRRRWVKVLQAHIVAGGEMTPTFSSLAGVVGF